MPIATTSVSALPVAPFHSPERTCTNRHSTSSYAHRLALGHLAAWLRLASSYRQIHQQLANKDAWKNITALRGGRTGQADLV